MKHVLFFMEPHHNKILYSRGVSKTPGLVGALYIYVCMCACAHVYVYLCIYIGNILIFSN